ncbi:MAG: metal-dependent hydrolase, partial [Lewinella sp.]|nr:metal-dependent hydrolase [Lewinella sp.]
MDSITQITLGAAVGEVVLGKKAGNRAMLWGAIAGTLPDLDVFANAVTDEISALAYHRAFTHSLTFAIVTPLAMGLLVHRLYGGREGPGPDSFWRT